MKILHLIASLAPRYGGPSQACVDMARALARRDHHVEIFTTDLGGHSRVTATGPITAVRDVAIHYFQSRLQFLWPISPAMFEALGRRIKEFDLVHIHSLYLFHGLAGGYWCRRFGVPYCVRPHGTLDPYIYSRHRRRKAMCEMLFEDRNLRCASAVHFTSEGERQLAQSIVGPLPSFVVPLGLHLENYRNIPPKGTFREAFPEVQDRRILLHLGRINFKKGLDLLVDAFARTLLEHPDLHLVLAGPDDEGYGASVRRWLRARGVEGRATFTGMLQGELKLAALRDASVFALPSYSENFGIAVAEAMACGVPVVISNKVNIWREVADASAGIVVNCDSGECSAAFSRLLTDSELGRQVGSNGQRLVARQFDWRRVGAQLERAYLKVIAGRGVSAPPLCRGQAL